MRIYYVLLLIFLSFFSASLSAITIVEIVDNAYRVNHPSADDTYRSTDSRIKPPTTTTRRLLREGFRFTPGGAVRTTVMTLAGGLLADYVWNETTEWWDRQLQPEYTPPPGASCQVFFQGSSYIRGSNTFDAFSEGCSSLGGSLSYLDQSRDKCSLTFTIARSSSTGALGFSPGIDSQSAIDDCYLDPLMVPTDEVRVPLSPKDFSDFIVNNDPELGIPLIQNIPTTTLRDIIGHDPDTSTRRGSPSDAISPTSSRQPVTVNTTDPNTGQITSTTEWPAFCTWASIVCEFIDWMTENKPPPEEEVIPSEEIGESQTYNSGLGGGSCPAGVNFTINGNAVNYSFQPACDAMIWFKPILLGMCTLIAGYILVGHKQG